MSESNTSHNPVHQLQYGSQWEEKRASKQFAYKSYTHVETAGKKYIHFNISDNCLLV